MRAVALCSLVLVAAALAVSVEPGHACSCALPDPRAALTRADAAFVGRLVSRRRVDELSVLLVFSVERNLKGPLGKTVEVFTARDGAACGLELPVGARVGLVLDDTATGWQGYLCSQFSPEDLLAAALPLPPPNGRGPAALFIGGGFGPVRMLALDDKGRTLAYGMGVGSVGALSVCPGGMRVAELAYLDPGREVAIRDARSLRVIRRVPLRLPGRYPLELLCENAAGSSVVVFATGPGDAGAQSAIYRLTGRRLTAVWHGSKHLFHLASLTAPVAYLTSPKESWQGCRNWRSCYRLVGVDLGTGRETHVITFPWSPSLTPDATGNQLAGVDLRESGDSRVILVDLTSRPARLLSAPLGASAVVGGALWLQKGRFLVLPRSGTARVLDTSLRTRSRFRWTGASGTLVGSTVFGIDRTGRLVSATLPSGPMRVGRRLPARPFVIVSAT